MFNIVQACVKLWSLISLSKWWNISNKNLLKYMYSKIRKECDFQDFWPQCASTYVIWNWLFDKTFVFDVSFPFLIADAWNLYKKLPRTESIKSMICYIFIQMWQKCFFHTKMCNHHWCFPHKLVVSIRKTSVLMFFDRETCSGPKMTF